MCPQSRGAITTGCALMWACSYNLDYKNEWFTAKWYSFNLSLNPDQESAATRRLSRFLVFGQQSLAEFDILRSLDLPRLSNSCLPACPYVNGHRSKTSMLISEIYESKQGEGTLAGQPSVFIRTSGCNLRCRFCDTPFASWNPEGNRQTVQEIVESACTFESRYAVLTGGEPMLPRNIELLTDLLRRADFHITIETAGTIFRDVQCDLMSISPKLGNSTPSLERAGDWSLRHEETRLNVDAVNQLMRLCDYQLKFVVELQADLEEIEDFLSQLDSFDAGRVLLMPEGVDAKTLTERESWLQPLCVEKGYAFCQRQHIFWYGNERGT